MDRWFPSYDVFEDTPLHWKVKELVDFSNPLAKGPLSVSRSNPLPSCKDVVQVRMVVVVPDLGKKNERVKLKLLGESSSVHH